MPPRNPILISALAFGLTALIGCGTGPEPRPVAEGDPPTGEQTAREAGEAADDEDGLVLYETNRRTGGQPPSEAPQIIDEEAEPAPAEEETEPAPGEDTEPSDESEQPEDGDDAEPPERQNDEEEPADESTEDTDSEESEEEPAGDPSGDGEPDESPGDSPPAEDPDSESDDDRQ